MKAILVIFAVIALPAHADIYVCMDDKRKMVYQDEPCDNQTLRTIKNVPAPTAEEQALAQERIDKINETSRVRAAETAVERLEQEKRELELERIALEKQRIELLEEQALNERHPYPIYVNPRYKNRFGGQPLNRPAYRNFPNRLPGNPSGLDPKPGNPTSGNPANVRPANASPANTMTPSMR